MQVGRVEPNSIKDSNGTKTDIGNDITPGLTEDEIFLDNDLYDKRQTLDRDAGKEYGEVYEDEAGLNDPKDLPNKTVEKKMHHPYEDV